MLNQTELPQKQNLLQKLARVFDIYPDEEHLFLLLFIRSFCLGFMMICIYTASNTLFLLEFGAEYMPYIYITSGIVNVVVGLAFVRLERFVSFSLLLTGHMIFLIASVFALWLGLLFFEAPWIVFALTAWMRVLWVLTILEIWALIGRVFNVRQGKRLFPLMSLGAIIGSILAGVLCSLIISVIGAVNLVLISALTLGVSLLVLLVIIKKYHSLVELEEGDQKGRSPQSGQLKKRKTQGDNHSYFQLFKSPYILFLFIVSSLSILGTYTLEFAFVKEVRSRYDAANAMGQFLGAFSAISTLCLLLFSLSSRRLLHRFGLKICILLNPAVLGVGIVLTIVSVHFWGEGALLFWLTALIKLSDEIFIGLNNSTRNILYQPIREDQRVSVQTAVESVIAPLSISLVGVGLLLVGLFSSLGTMEVFYLLLGIVVSWYAMSLLLNSQYGVAIKQTLTRRQWDKEKEVIALDISSVELLRQELTNPQPGAVLYALDMLSAHDPASWLDLLPNLLHHPNPEIRKNVLKRLERYPSSKTLTLIKERITSDSEPKVRGAALRALTAIGQTEVVADIAPYLEDPVEPVRIGAMVGLLRNGGLEGTWLAGQKLWKMIDSHEWTERAIAAQVLGQVGIRTFYQPLIKLINDPNTQVQRAALTAAGQLKSAKLWPVVVSKLASHEVGREAASAMITGGESALPALTEAFNPDEQPVEVLCEVAQILSRIRGQQVISCLLPHLHLADQRLRNQILHALSRCGYHAQANEITAIEGQIKGEVELAVWLLNIIAQLHGVKDSQIKVGTGGPEVVQTFSEIKLFLEKVFHERLAETLHRILYLLSFIYDSQAILRAMDIFECTKASPKEKGYALEMLDILISYELRSLIFPLLQNLSPSEQLKQLTPFFPQSQIDFEDCLQELVSDIGGRSDSWLQVCALYAMCARVWPKLSEECFSNLKGLLQADDPLVRETALQALSCTQPAGFEQSDLLVVLQNDPSPQVARLARCLANPEMRKNVMLSTIERVLFLKGIDLFTEIPGEDLVQVARVAQEVTFSPGEYFIKQKELGDSLYIIIDGEARILVNDEREIATLGAKDVIGEMAILTSSLRTASAVAMSEITALKIEREDFQELMIEKPDLALGVIKVLVQRLEAMSHKTSGIS